MRTFPSSRRSGGSSPSVTLVATGPSEPPVGGGPAGVPLAGVGSENYSVPARYHVAGCSQKATRAAAGWLGEVPRFVVGRSLEESVVSQAPVSLQAHCGCPRCLCGAEGVFLTTSRLVVRYPGRKPRHC